MYPTMETQRMLFICELLAVPLICFYIEIDLKCPNHQRKLLPN